MRWMRFLTSVALMAIWLFPGVLSGTLAMHLTWGHSVQTHTHDAEHHHDDSHEGVHEHQHEADCRLGPGHHEDLASTLADIIHHGHQHDEAETADHEHDVRIQTPHPFEKPNLQTAAWLPKPSPALSLTPSVLAIPTASDPASPPPLFTANCSLLI